jgi:hypothetical protein
MKVVTESWIDQGRRIEWMLGAAASVLLVPQSICSIVYVISLFAGRSLDVPGLPQIDVGIKFGALAQFLALIAAPFIYSVFCVWWLFIRFPLTGRAIPAFIRTGIFMGTASVVLFAFPGTVYPILEQTRPLRIALILYMYGGPQLMALMLLFLIRRQSKHSRRALRASARGSCADA